VTVRFLEIAEIELDQAIHWYGARAPGLGDAFLIEVLSAADRIVRAKASTAAASAAFRIG
jgi:toxin ParE2